MDPKKKRKSEGMQRLKMFPFTKAHATLGGMAKKSVNSELIFLPKAYFQCHLSGKIEGIKNLKGGFALLPKR